MEYISKTISDLINDGRLPSIKEIPKTKIDLVVTSEIKKLENTDQETKNENK